MADIFVQFLQRFHVLRAILKFLHENSDIFEIKSLLITDILCKTDQQIPCLKDGFIVTIWEVNWDLLYENFLHQNNTKQVFTSILFVDIS